jgi:O-antigen/teichoic acid export membrane protein
VVLEPPDVIPGSRRRAFRQRATGLTGQSAIFTLASGVSTLLTAAATAIFARQLTSRAFGDFSFAISFFMFVGMFFDFGLFLPAARIAAAAEPETRRRVVGAALVAFAGVAAAFVAVAVVLSIWIDAVFNVDAGPAIRIAAPLALVFPFQSVALRLAQGVERLHVYSISYALGQLILVAALAVMAGVGTSVDTTTATLLRVGAALAGMLWLAVWLRPRFAGVRDHIAELVRQARSYGFQVYLGNVLGIGTYNMDVLMVAAWTSSRQVGLYALAVAMTNVIGLPVIGYSSALFPRLVGRTRLDYRWVAVALAVGAVGAAALVGLARPLVDLFFSHRYDGAVALVLPLALAQIVRGVTGVYNGFLSANARGVELRNAAIVLMVSNVALNFALIPSYGARGAAWASLAALVANFAAHVWYYRRSLRGAGASSQLEASSRA